MSATIVVDAADPSLVTVSGRFDSGDRQNFWFLKDFAGNTSLGSRISGVALTNAGRQTVVTTRLQPGEYLASANFQSWTYKIDLTPPKPPSAAAHISWIATDRGLLMLGDILPQVTKGIVTVDFVLPPGWSINTTTTRIGDNKFQTGDPEKTVFLIGRNFRTQAIPVGSPTASLITADHWQFADEDAAAISKEIYDSYKKLFGRNPADSFRIALVKFPGAASAGIWEADTRGSTITILSSDMAFKTQSLQRLHEQLRHEIFHLWIPNGVNLSGSYDWFYEGFALYASLKGGVMMNRIRFEDFLDTLARAYTIDSFQIPHMSLIEASQKRWSGANTTVYARGMIAAFLCDLALLKDSRGKIDVSNILKEVFDKYRSQADRTDGNEAVFSIMSRYPALEPVVQRYIKGKYAIDWPSDLAAAGIAAVESNSVTTLKVVEKPDGRQKAMLDRLGYNSWRKLAESSK